MTDASEIRPLQASDVDAAAELLGELGYPSSAAALGARVKLLGDSQLDLVLVAARSGRLVGLASVHLIPMLHRDGFVGRLTSFVVAETARGGGVGSALLAACERDAHARGAERMEISSGDARHDAHAFYAAQGFEREGQRLTKWLRGAEGAGD